MSLSIGIVGLPNVGKSTLFNALTNNDILAANYPFATIEPNTGIVPVPDNRLEELAKIYGSKKLLPATVKFVDIAGLVAGASTGEGLGNKFLANIRQCEAIVHVVRTFEDGDVIHVSDSVDPSRDIETIETELILADIQTLENHLPKLQKEAKAKPKTRELVVRLESILESLRSETPVNKQPDIDPEDVSHLNLLTAKPVIFAFNVSEDDLTNQSRQDELSKLVSPSETVFVSAKLEEEIKGLDQSEAKELLEGYGVKDTGLSNLIQAAYATLGLQSYLTAGPQEVRAWTIKQGATAPEAAGVIHGDFERGFIAAQVVSFSDLKNARSLQNAKSEGLVRTEGKTYIMQPDDVVEFKFNV